MAAKTLPAELMLRPILEPYYIEESTEDRLEFDLTEVVDCNTEVVDCNALPEAA